MAFATLTMCQLFHAFNVRSEDRSLFAQGVLSNPAMNRAFLAGMAMQLSVLLLPAPPGGVLGDPHEPGRSGWRCWPWPPPPSPSARGSRPGTAAGSRPGRRRGAGAGPAAKIAHINSLPFRHTRTERRDSLCPGKDGRRAAPPEGAAV